MSRLTRRVEKAARQPPVDAPAVGYPTSLAWSHDGQVLAVGDDSGELLLVRAGSSVSQRVRAHDGPIQSLGWHPREERLVTTGQDGAVRLWTAPFQTPIVLVAPSTTWADHPAWSPQGDHLAVALGSRACLFGPAGRIDLPPVASTVAALAFTPTGKTLGIACYGGVSLFSPATGALVKTLRWKGSLLSLVFSPDGSIVAGGCQDHSVHFWRIASGKDAQMSGYPAKPHRVAFSHDGQWLATSGDVGVSLWPFDKKGPEGRAPVQLADHPGLVTALGFAPLVDVLLSGSRDGTVALWTPPKLRTPVWATRLGGAITQVAWGLDGAESSLRWAAADEQGRVVMGVF